MMKTTRFRPIAPRPQEGVNATKEKLSSTLAKTTPSVKADTKKVEPLAKLPVQKSVEKEAVAAGEAEISLDPKNFCYPDLKQATSDFETSSGMTGFYSGYNGYYYNSCNRMQYVGNHCHMSHCQAGPGCCNTSGMSGYGGQLGYNGQSYSSGYPPMNSSMAMQLPRKDQLMSTDPNNTNCNNLTMKLDLDEDSVAKAFGDEYESSKERIRESDGSVDGNDSAPTSRQQEKAGKDTSCKKQDAGSGSDVDTTNTNMDHRLAASGSVVKNLSHKGFVNCIAKGSTNPLFHIEKRLACSFITEFLENEDVLESFKEKQKIKDALQELESFSASEEIELKEQQQPLQKKQKV